MEPSVPQAPPPPARLAPNSPRPPRPIAWGRHSIWAGSLVVFVIALFLPCLLFQRGTEGELQAMPGWEVLVTGWLGVFLSVPQLAWYANIPWLVSLSGIAFRKPLLALIPAFLALCGAAQTFMLFGVKVPTDESGMHHKYLESLEIGAYVWMLALSVPLVWGILALLLRRKPATPA